MSAANTSFVAVLWETSTSENALLENLCVYVTLEIKLMSYRQCVYFYTWPEDFRTYDLIKQEVANQKIRADMVCVEIIKFKSEKHFMKEVLLLDSFYCVH